MSDDDDKKGVSSPRGTNLDHTSSEELAPRKRGLSGLISRVMARSSVITDRAETQKRQARKEALESQIELGETVEKALHAQSRLHYVQENQDKIAKKVHADTEMEYELRHAENEISMQEKMADVERRRKRLQENHDQDVEADAIRRGEREYGFEQRRANLDAKRNPPEPEKKQEERTHDPRKGYEKMSDRQHRERGTLDDWFELEKTRIDGDNALTDDDREVKHAQLEQQYRNQVSDLERRHRDEVNREAARRQ